MDDTMKVLILVIAGHLAVLTAIILIIKRLLVGDTLRAVQRISEAEADVRKKEEAVRRQMEQSERDLRERQAQLEQEFEKRRETADRSSAQLKEEITEEARRDAAAIMDQARKNERKMRDQLKQEMAQQAVDAGAQLFNMVFSDKITEQLNRVFIDELLEALKTTDASGITVQADDAQFSSSHPLDAVHRETLRGILHTKFGLDVEIREDVRPELLAGLILKLGSLEIDGSLLSRFREAATELKKEVLR